MLGRCGTESHEVGYVRPIKLNNSGPLVTSRGGGENEKRNLGGPGRGRVSRNPGAALFQP